MTITVTIVQSGVTDEYGRTLVVGNSYSLPDDLARAYVSQQKATPVLSPINVANPPYLAGNEFYIPSPAGSPNETSSMLQSFADMCGSMVLAGTPGTVYEISKTLVVKSGSSVVFAPGIIFKAARGMVGPMVSTWAYLNARPVAVVSVTSSGTVATVTRLAHGRAVGDWISLTGSTTSGYNGVYRIATVPTVNTYTVRLEMLPAATTAAGTVYERTADHDIYLGGEGIIDGNKTYRSTVGDARDFGIIIAHAANVTFDLKGVNPLHRFIAPACVNHLRGRMEVSDGTGGFISFGCMANVDVDLEGWNLTDDLCGIQNSDYSAYNPIEGDIIKCRIGRIRGQTATNGIKIVGGTSGITELRVDHFEVETGSNGIQCDNDTSVRNYGLTVNQLSIGTFKHVNPTTNTGGIVCSGGGGTSLVKQLTVENMKTTVASGKTYWAVTSNNASYAEIQDVSLSNVDLRGATNSQGVYLLFCTGKLTQARLNNIRMENAANLFTHNSTSTESGNIVEANNVRLIGCSSVISFRQAMTAYINNLYGTSFGNGAWSSDQAVVLTVYAKNINISNYYDNLSGSATITPYGGDIQIDGAKVTAAANVEFWNTSGTFNASSGIGRYIRTNAGAWQKVA